MPFLETPLYSHYHLFLRSFHARPWKSFRLSRPIPPHARFPLWETSRLLSLPLVKSSNAVAIFGIPCPPSSWNKRGTAQSRQKISKSLDKGVLETPSLPPSLPPLPLQLSSSIGPSCHCGASRKRKRELWTMFSIYLSWCWTYQGASFRDEILFNCKINRGEISGINSTGYWLCENAW